MAFARLLTALPGATPNAELVETFPQHTDTAGARRLEAFFSITTERDLTVHRMRIEARRPGERVAATAVSRRL